MAHLHEVYDTDKHFSIDPITRAIKNNSASKTKVMQYDHNSERFAFIMPKTVEAHDMSLCNKVRVEFINIDSKDNTKLNADAYEVDDLQTITTEDDGDQIVFSWLISQNATKLSGSLNFLIRFMCIADDGTLEYAWHTDIFTGISVSSGMYNGEIIVEQYSDVLEAWKKELEAAGGGGTSFSGSASDVTYDDAETKLGATNIQDAVGKLSEQKVNGIGIKNIIALTKVEYDALEVKDATTLYIIIDATGGDDTGSGEEEGGEDTPTTMIPMLTSDGVAYINLGVVPSATQSYEICLRDMSKSADTHYFGNRFYNMKNVGIGSVDEETYWIASTVNGQYRSFGKVRVGTKKVYKITPTNLFVDGESVLEYDAVTTTQKANNMLLFTTNSSDQQNGMHVSESDPFTFFYLKIWEGEELIHEYRPTKDESGVACVYDKVAGEYLYNSAESGTFTYSEELEES